VTPREPDPQSWTVEWAGPARRALERLPLKIAMAVFAFATGELARNPPRTAKPLSAPFEGRSTAVVGAYRVITVLDPGTRTVYIQRIEHRADVYRRRD
jgi:mRNA-degrading endonuclease RelE of RelBE toxin-antitoxin system